MEKHGIFFNTVFSRIHSDEVMSEFVAIIYKIHNYYNDGDIELTLS